MAHFKHHSHFPSSAHFGMSLPLAGRGDTWRNPRPAGPGAGSGGIKGMGKGGGRGGEVRGERKEGKGRPSPPAPQTTAPPSRTTHAAGASTPPGPRETGPWESPPTPGYRRSGVREGRGPLGIKGRARTHLVAHGRAHAAVPPLLPARAGSCGRPCVKPQPQ